MLICDVFRINARLCFQFGKSSQQSNAAPAASSPPPSAAPVATVSQPQEKKDYNQTRIQVRRVYLILQQTDDGMDLNVLHVEEHCTLLR